MTKKQCIVPLSELKIHPLVLKMKTYTPDKFMTFSMIHFTQMTNIVVVERNGKYFIVDGGYRYHAALKSHSIKTLKCDVIDISDDEILNVRINCNQKTKLHTSEICRNVEHLLGLIGTTQGKRNDLLGMNNPDDENEYGTAGKDRFEIACMSAGLDFSSRTLRKLMNIYEFEKTDNSLGLIEGINNGIFKIDAAYKLMRSKICKEEIKSKRNQIKIDRLNFDVWGEVFEQSTTDLSNIKHLKPKFAMFSPPYWKMKHYRNQGEIKYGQEPTLQEYLDNSKRIMEELIGIMDENGVIVIVIGEPYNGGYKSITSKYELMLLSCGIEILGVCEWVKLNPTPTVPKNFFRPANEKIFVCKMNGAEITFNPKMKTTKDGVSSVKKSHKGNNGNQRFFVEDGETIISNVITTAVFNPSEYKKYDPEFTHDAPSPMEIYDIFTSSYTLPGDTCIDIHCGSGQGLEVFLKNGCNAIGVDIDPVSVEFCKKRINMILGERFEEDNNAKQAA
jgi:DNA modification methylase